MSYYMDEDFTPPSPPRPPPRPARTCSVVFLGETGAGKSCAVNALSLMSKRVTIENMPCVTKAETATVIDEDDEWAEVTEDVGVADADEVREFLTNTFSHCVIPSTLTRDLDLLSKDHNESLLTGASQTLKPKLFSFKFPRKSFDFHLKIIDTPGMGDTRGHGQDELNIDMILEYLCSVDDLGGLVLVLNGTMSRVSASVKDVVNKLKSILPACVFESCFYILFTNTDSCGSNYNTDWLFSECEQKPKVNTFHINNSLFSLSLDQWNKVTPVDKARLVTNWHATRLTLKNLVATVSSNTSALAPAYREMRIAHSEFLETFSLTQASIRNLLEKCRAIYMLTQNMITTQNNQGTEIQHELKTQLVQVVKFVKESYYSTLCVNHVFSGTICHRGCSLDETPFSGDPDTWAGNDIFNGCAAFNSNNICVSCPASDKCSAAVHFHSYELPTFVEVPAINLQDEIFTEYLGRWKDRDLIDNYKDAITMMRDALLDQINALFAKALQLKKKVYYFDFKKYIQSSLDVLKLELTVTGDGPSYDRLIQLCEVYAILIININKTDLAPLTELNIPLIEGVLKLDKNDFLDEKLAEQLEDLERTKNTIVNGVDEASIPKAFVKLYEKRVRNQSPSTSPNSKQANKRAKATTKSTTPKKPRSKQANKPAPTSVRRSPRTLV